MYEEGGKENRTSEQSFTLVPSSDDGEAGFAKAIDYISSNLVIIGAVAVFVGAALIKGIGKFVRRKLALKKNTKKQAPEAFTAASKGKLEKDARDEALKQKKQKQQQLVEHNRFLASLRQSEEADGEDFGARENVIEKVYSMDWNKDGFSTPMEQYSSSLLQSQSVASMFYGEDARHEIATLLSSIITMHRQGLSDVQISRILAGTKLLNPGIDSRTMQSAADFYLKILEEFNLAGEVSRYSGQVNTYEMPYTDKEVMRALAKGDISPLTEVFDSLSKYKYQTAQNLPSGYLYTELMNEAADLKTVQGKIFFAEDISAAGAKTSEALQLFPSHAGALQQMAEINIAQGNSSAAADYYQKILDIKDIKTGSEAYQTAKEALKEINAFREKEARNEDLAAYHVALSKARSEVRMTIHNFFSVNEERKMSMV